MAKRKDGKALFEVLTGGEARTPPKALGVPGWFGEQPHRPGAPTPAPQPATQSPAREPASEPTAAVREPAVKPAVPPTVAIRTPARVPVAPRPALTSTLAQPAAPRPATTSASTPFAAPHSAVAVGAGGVSFTLNATGLAVAAMVLLVLVAGAFALGRKFGQPGAQAPAKAPPPQHASVERDAPAQQPPQQPGDTMAQDPGQTQGPENVADGSNVQAVDVLPDDSKRESGKSYLIIESGVQNEAEAQDIKSFLARHGVQATAHHGRNGTYTIKDMRGFVGLNTEQGRTARDQYVLYIGKLGQMYRELGKRYAFKQTNPGNPYMILEP